MSPIWKKGQRTQLIYLPAGKQWRDAWQPEKVYAGGETITLSSEPPQIPILVREGSNLKLGDLNREWAESLAVAQVRPNLGALDADLKAWFDRKYPHADGAFR